MTTNDREEKPERRVRCIGCGQPMTKGSGFCRECVDRFDFCEGCEGRPLADVEEDAS